MKPIKRLKDGIKNINTKLFTYLNRRHAYTFLILILFSLIFWYSYHVQSIFYQSIIVIESMFGHYPVLGMVMFFLLAVMSAIISPFSSVPLVPVAILIWGKQATLTMLLAGWIFGAIITYYIGYYAGLKGLSKMKLFEKIKFFTDALSKQTEFVMVLVFRIAMPAEVPGYVLGIMRYDFLKYLIATIIAEIPIAIISVYASEALLAKNLLLFFILVFGTFGIIGLTYQFFKRQIKADMNKIKNKIKTKIRK